MLQECYKSLQYCITTVTPLNSSQLCGKWTHSSTVTVTLLVKKFHAVFITCCFITVSDPILRQMIRAQNFILLWSIWLLSSYRILDLPSSLFLPSGFFTPTLYATVIRATSSAHLILLNFTTLIILGEQYGWQRFSLCSVIWLGY